MSANAELAKQLRAHREAAGISRADLAPKLGVDVSTLCRLEGGAIPITTDRLLDWCRAIGADAGELLTGVTPPELVHGPNGSASRGRRRRPSKKSAPVSRRGVDHG